MAAYRFSAKMIGRSGGRSATAAAAYRAGIEITDERTGLQHDYSRRSGVVHTEILTPDGAPEWASDRARLWNAVEHSETRSNSQLAREIQMNLPHELDDDARRALIREFVQEQFVSRGMAADLAIHAPDRQSDQRNHHAHVMLTTREFDGEEFHAKKQREWNDRTLLEQWRERWAEHQNLALERAGLDVRVDHRSYEDRGIDREAEPKLGPVATEMERQGRESHAGNDLRETWKRNAERDRREMQEIMLELQIAQEQAQEAAREPEQDQGLRYHFEDLYDAERANLGEQQADYQQQVDELTELVENRSRIAVFWDKLRGRLGWNAELELEAKRQQLEEAQERAEALELSYARQREIEDERRREQEQQAELEAQEQEQEWDWELEDYSEPPELSAAELRKQQIQDYLDSVKDAQEQGLEQDQDHGLEIKRD